MYNPYSTVFCSSWSFSIMIYSLNQTIWFYPIVNLSKILFMHIHLVGRGKNTIQNSIFHRSKSEKKLPREVKLKAAKTEEIYTESLRYCRHCVTLQHTMFEHYIHVEAIWWWWWWWWCNKKKSGNSNRWKYY